MLLAAPPDRFPPNHAHIQMPPSLVKSRYGNVARGLTREPPKCNITSLAAYQKVSTSAFSAMWRGAKCNRTAILLQPKATKSH